MSDSILDLSTEVAPTKKFTIDGDEYELFTLDNLSPRKEAIVSGTFARFQKVFMRLNRAKSDDIATREAERLAGYRKTLITTMTTVSEDTVDKLSPAAQGKLLDLVQTEIIVAGGGDPGDDDDGADDDD